MATPVPYEGAPNQAPGNNPTPSIQTQANPAAFGTNIAEAASHMGSVIEGSGKELFDRAYAMQELQVHADVNARLSDMGNKMNNAFVNYSELEGKQAVDGLKGFQDDLDKTRKEAGDGLSPIGQEFYDGESRSQRNRIGFAGAGHAAQQQKAYVVGSAQASMSNEMKTMELDPNNPGANAKSLDNIRSQADFISNTHGIPLDSPGAIKARNDAVNTAITGQIRSLAKDDPIGAQKLFDEQAKTGNIYGNDAAQLSWYVRNQRNNIGSRTTASNVISAGSAQGGPVLQALFKNESGGSLTVENPESTTSGHAQGAFQITTGTWREFASKAGVSLSDFPDAKSAPYAVQAQMANVIPLQRWDKTTIAKMQGAGGNLDVHKTLGENLKMNGEGLGATVPGTAATLQQLTTQGRSVAESQFPGDHDYADMVEDKIISQYNKEKSIRADTDFNNIQTVQGALLNGVGPQNQVPTSVDELRTDPKASAAWDALEAQHPTDLKQFMNQMASNAKGDVAMTPERLNNWQRLSGQATQDPEGFMQATQDLSQVDLPKAQKLEIVRMQQSIYKKEDANPGVTHAMGILNSQGILSAAGLTKEQDADGLAQFTGILSSAMKQFQTDNKKPMGDQDIKDASQNLLAQVGGGGFFHPFGGGGQQWFRSIDQVPSEAADAISQEMIKRGTIPNEAAVLQTYIGAQYQSLYGKSAKAQGAPGGK